MAAEDGQDGCIAPLVQVGLCQRCAFRLTGVRDAKAYACSIPCHFDDGASEDSDRQGNREKTFSSPDCVAVLHFL